MILSSIIASITSLSVVAAMSAVIASSVVSSSPSSFPATSVSASLKIASPRFWAAVSVWCVRLRPDLCSVST